MKVIDLVSTPAVTFTSSQVLANLKTSESRVLF